MLTFSETKVAKENFYYAKKQEKIRMLILIT